MPTPPDVVYWDEQDDKLKVIPTVAAMSRVQTFRLEKWWQCQPGIGTTIAVLARERGGVVVSVRLAVVSKNCVGLPGAAVGLAVYRGRVWPYFWRVRCEVL